MKVSLSRIHFPVTTLGPGRRIGIWFQGCSIRCAGCISADTWAAKEADITVSQLLETLDSWLAECDGVTISGGEPFEQVDGLTELLTGIRDRSDCNVLVYSGLPEADLRKSWLFNSGLIDALMSEPFLLAAPQTLALRGSDNQKLHYLTARGFADFSGFNRLITQADKRLDVMFDSDGVAWLAGVPQRGDMRRLQEILSLQGDAIALTEARQ